MTRRLCFHIAALFVLHGAVGYSGAPAQTPPAPQPAPATPNAPAPGAKSAPAPDAKAAAGTDPKAAAKFPTDRLEQIAAPIALYPDSLLMQMCMASTYPIEVVQAFRFVDQNPKLAGKDLESALKGKDWDASVKSLCGFKTVLKQMNDNLDWTQDLGDAFLGQQAELLDAVQRLRGKAQESGNLKTTEQQKVTVQQDKTIIIESASPQVVYVPTYSPTVVYGPSWGYPVYAYPPMYSPGAVAGAMALSFTAGAIIGGAMWGGCNWGWGHSEVDIDVDHNYNFNRNTSNNTNINRADATKAGTNKSTWQHDPSHRKGVGYKDGTTAQKYGGQQGTNRVSRDQARGFDRSAGGSASPRPSTSPSTRPSAASRPSTASRPSGSGAGGSGTARNSSSQLGSSSSRSGGGGFSGSKQPQLDRAASSRGSASRGGGGGGGSRGGGGRGGGGRR